MKKPFKITIKTFACLCIIIFSTSFVKCVTNMTGMSEEERIRLSKEAVERIAASEGYTVVWDELNKNSANDSNSTPSTPQHVHDYTSSVTKEATCSEEGEITYTCSGCGKSYTEPIPKTDHTWEETIITPATCSTEGKVKKVCSVCGEEVVEVIPCNPEVHNYEEVIVKEATCTEDGVAKKVCKSCGAETEEYSIPAVGHNYEVSVTKEPTCTEVGIKTFTCANCGDTYTEDTPVLGHDETSAYVYKAKIGSLVFDGKTVYTCSRCGEVREEADPSTYPIIYLISAVVLLVVIITTIIVLIVTRKVKKDGE